MTLPTSFDKCALAKTMIDCDDLAKLLLTTHIRLTNNNSQQTCESVTSGNINPRLTLLPPTQTNFVCTEVFKNGFQFPKAPGLNNDHPFYYKIPTYPGCKNVSISDGGFSISFDRMIETGKKGKVGGMVTFQNALKGIRWVNHFSPSFTYNILPQPQNCIPVEIQTLPWSFIINRFKLQTSLIRFPAVNSKTYWSNSPCILQRSG